MITLASTENELQHRKIEDSNRCETFKKLYEIGTGVDDQHHRPVFSSFQILKNLKKLIQHFIAIAYWLSTDSVGQW